MASSVINEIISATTDVDIISTPKRINVSSLKQGFESRH